MTEPQQTRILQTYALLREQQDPSASSSGGAHPAVEQTLQDVLEFGRLPKELKNPATETELAESRLAYRLRWHHLRERAQKMLEELKATKDAASGSSAVFLHLTDQEKLLWKFLDEFKRKPLESKNASIAERKLAKYIRLNRSKLDTEIKIRLNALDDPAGCASFAKKTI